MFTKYNNLTRTSFQAGDLKHRIELQTRSQEPPPGAGVDFVQVYTKLREVWAGLKVVSGKEIFGGINKDERITHIFYIRYCPDVDVNTWILHAGQRYNIIDGENLNGLNQWLALRCNIKGDSTKVGSGW